MNASLKGFLSENQTCLHLMDLNFQVSKPILDVYGYDFVVFYKGKSNRIQVKSVYAPLCGNKYRITLSHGYVKTAYTSSNIDFFICYVADISVWYIIPVEVVLNKHIFVYPNVVNSVGRYEIFKNAWELLK